MSKLVAAEKWIARHFEPTSEPTIDQLKEWAITENKGAVIAGQLFIKHDALAAVSPPPSTEQLAASDLLS